MSTLKLAGKGLRHLQLGRALPSRLPRSAVQIARQPLVPAARENPKRWPRPPALLRSFATTSERQHGHITPPKPGEELYVTFIDKEGKEHKLAVSEGDNLLDIAQAHDLEMEGKRSPSQQVVANSHASCFRSLTKLCVCPGACGGSCACSTCHVIVTDEDYFNRIPEASDDENDMLDLAFGLTATSRLGCQVVMTKELDGLTVRLPAMTRNLQASDFK